MNIPPALLDVNLEPNKTSVMLTNKDELMTILTNLLDKFYSDEKNVLPGSRNLDSNNGAEKRIAVIGKLDDITNTCGLNGEVTTTGTHASSSVVTESKAQETSIYLDRNVMLENTCGEQEDETHNELTKTSSTSNFDNNSTPKNTSSINNNDFLREESSSHDRTSPNNQGEHKSPSLAVAETVAETVTDQAVCLPSALQEDTNTLTHTDSFLSDSVNSFRELRETLSDKTLCEISESTCDLEDNVRNSSKESDHSRVTENSNFEISNNLSNLNGNNEEISAVTADTGNGSNAASADERSKESQEMPTIRTMACTPSSSPSLENLFSFDVDDLFNDSDLELSGASNNVRNAEKATSAEMPSSATKEGCVSVEKPSMTVVSSGTPEAQCSDKEWSMGRGIVDKQGNPVQVFEFPAVFNI